MIGTRLGPYEVVAPIDAGGMGEVCGPRTSGREATWSSRSYGRRSPRRIGREHEEGGQS
jgi:hypothetical protein